jgi:CheY-like chemotaxis protein
MGAQPPLLLVEDSEDDVFLMTRALKSAAVELPLQVVEDGRRALDYLSGAGAYSDRRAYPLPALIFLDIKLPQVSGLEVLRWIRENPHLRRTVVIVLTSSNYPEDVRQAYNLGANSYIVKPAKFQQLVEFVKAFKTYWLFCNRPPV